MPNQLQRNYSGPPSSYEPPKVQPPPNLIPDIADRKMTYNILDRGGIVWVAALGQYEKWEQLCNKLTATNEEPDKNINRDTFEKLHSGFQKVIRDSKEEYKKQVEEYLNVNVIKR